MANRKKKVFKGTDIEAYKKAGKKGGTPQQMSRNYYNEKRKNEEKKYRKSLLKVQKHTIAKFSKINNLSKKQKYVPKETIFDLIRKYKSPKWISNVSNRFSKVIAKSFGKKLNNNEKDFVRSAMALVISESLNKVLEKPLNFIENIKMFIKVGKAIYKAILKFNENSKKFDLDDNNVFEVDEKNREYQAFLIQYPKLREKYELDYNRETFIVCPLCNSKLKLIVEENKEFYICSNYFSGKCEYKRMKN